MTQPDKIIPLVRGLFEKENLTAPLDAAAYLEAHPEEVAAFVSTVALLGRDIVGYAEDFSPRSADEIIDFLPLPKQG